MPLPAPFELREILLLLVLLPFVIVPSSVERRVARGLAAYVLRRRGKMRAIRLAKLPPELSTLSGLTPETLVLDVESETIRERIRLLRGIVFPWWTRRLRIAGLAHVRAGLEAGHGVILWIVPSAQSNVAVKQAAHTAGFPLAHLSRPGHPASSQPFGIRFLNPILRRPEVRFLAERVPIDEKTTIAPLRRMRTLLGENRVVSITVTSTASSLQQVEFLGGALSLSLGPIQLANSTGAWLLPVFAYEAAGRTHVEFGAPLLHPGMGPKPPGEVIADAVSWLQVLVLEHPEAWIGWRSSQFRIPR